MIKILGCLFIITATTLVGYMCSNKLELRCSQIDDIIKMLFSMIEQLKYSKGSCQSIVTEIERRGIVNSTDIVKRFIDTPETMPFPIRWENAVDGSNLVLDISEYKELRSISDILGAFSAEEQMTSLVGVAEFFKARKETLQKYTVKQSKLYRVMGVLSGAAIVIFIV